MSELLSSSVSNKYSIKSVEEDLKNALYKKFGARYLKYRDKYSDYLGKKKTEEILEYPISVILELVNRCNLECTMCYQGFRNDTEKSVLSDEDLKNLFEEFKKNKLDALLLSTSEPLLYKKFSWIVEMAAKAEIMDIFMFTNGILLNEKNSDIILNSAITRLFISIDAATEETYDKVRIPVNKKILNTNRLAKLEENVINFVEKRKKLKKILPLVRVSFVVLEKNKHELNNFINKWEKIVDSVEIQTENSIDLYDQLKNNFIIKKKLKEYKCNEPWGQVAIHADGTVGPCCNTVGRNVPIGNVKNESLKEIWSGKLMKDIRDGFLINKPNKVCQLCLENVNKII
tara:strand:+ start:3919 stop:4950 length:1032 start_codon:yes stop_codon:yes gene_type:complete